MGLTSVSSVGLVAVVRGIAVIVSVTKKALIIVGHVHTGGTSRAFAVRRGTVGHGRCDTSSSPTAVTAGSSAWGDILVGQLEVFLFFGRGEFAVLRPGVMLGLDVSAAVNLDLRGNPIHAGFATTASPRGAVSGSRSGSVVGSLATSAVDRRHATPVPGSGSVSGLGYSPGVGEEDLLHGVKGEESVAINQDRRMDRVESGVFDAVPKIKDFHLFSKGVHTMFGQILVEVVLFNMLIDVGLKGETPAFGIEPVVLKVLDDPILGGGGHSFTEEVSVKGTVGLSTVLRLGELFSVGPCG